MTDLVSEIGDMTHSARAEFFETFQQYVAGQAEADTDRGRVRYAGLLSEIAIKLAEIKELEDECWQICEPFTIVSDREHGE